MVVYFTLEKKNIDCYQNMDVIFCRSSMLYKDVDGIFCRHGDIPLPTHCA